MGELEKSESADAVAAPGGGADAVRYGIVVAQLTAAGERLRGLGERVRSAYRYVDGCSASVDRLAEQMAALSVDVDTVAKHRTAATVMRSVLAEAEAMAANIEDLSALFGQTADAHQADYGPVVDAARSMPVEMADAGFYGNR